MKKLLFIALMFLGYFLSAQDTKPVSTDFKNLQSPSFSYFLQDSTVWIYKGSTYGWTKLFSAKKTQHKIDSLAFHVNDTLAYYKLKSDSIELSGFFTQFDALDKKDISDSTDIAGYTRRDRLASELAKKENTLTKGNLTESIAGLQFDATRQVIGGAADLQLSSGYGIPTTTNIAHGESGYDDKVNSLSVTGDATKTITLNQQDGGTVANTFSVSKSDVGLSELTNDAQVKRSEMAEPNGVATLDANGKLPSSQIPSLAISETFTGVNAEDRVLASDAEIGDVFIATGVNKSYILQTEPYSTLNNWQLLRTPDSPIQSVNGQVGNVSLTTSDIAEGTNKYYTEERVAANSAVAANTAKVGITTDQAAAIVANSAKVSNANHTGEVTGATALTITSDAVTNAKLANMTVSTIKGRVTAGTGDPEDLTATQVRTLLNVANGANAYVHPNHSGDVTSVADGAQTIAANAVTNAKAAQMATKTYKGRTSAGTGNAEDVAIETLKADLAVNNVDNTSDINKPVSTAQQTALDAKQNNLTGTGFVKSTAGTISYDNSTYKPDFAENTGFNKNFGTTTGTVLEGSSYTASDVLNKIKTVDGSGSGLDADMLDGIHSDVIVYGTNNTASTLVVGDANTQDKSGFYYYNTGSTNVPSLGNLIHTSYTGAGYDAQLLFWENQNRLSFRRQNGTTWQNWNELYHSGNHRSDTQNDAVYEPAFSKNTAFNKNFGTLTTQVWGYDAHPTTTTGYGLPDYPTLSSLSAAPSSGSANYIQNGTIQQTTSNFNISGSGTLGGTIQSTTAKLTNLTDGYLPYHISDGSGLGNSPVWTDGTKVGINNTSARAYMDIVTTASLFQRAMVLGPRTSTIGDGSYIEFTSSSIDGYGAQIGGIREGAGGTNAFVIRTGGNAQTEKFRVSNSGNADVGYSGTRTEKFAVNGSGYYAGAVEVRNTYASTNSALPVATFGRATSGTAANGIGAELVIMAEDDAGSLRETGTIRGILSSVTAASPVGYLGLSGRGSAIGSEHLKIMQTGQVNVISTTASTSTSTGALTVGGGLGVGGAGYFGGTVTSSSLAGTGTRMVTADDSGTLGTTAIKTNLSEFTNDLTLFSGSYNDLTDKPTEDIITPQTLSGTSPTWDMEDGINATITLSGNTTITMSNLVAGKTGSLTVKNASTQYTLNISQSGYVNAISKVIGMIGNYTKLNVTGASAVDKFSWSYDGYYLFWKGETDFITQ
jgi:hypothetical protein